MCAAMPAAPQGTIFSSHLSQKTPKLPLPSLGPAMPYPSHSYPLSPEVWPSEDRHCGWRSGQEVPSSSFLCSSPPHLSLRACHGILTGRYPLSAVCLAPMMGSSLPPRGAAGRPVGNCPERTGQEGREWGPGSALNTQGLGLSPDSQA